MFLKPGVLYKIKKANSVLSYRNTLNYQFLDNFYYSSASNFLVLEAFPSVAFSVYACLVDGQKLYLPMSDQDSNNVEEIEI